MTAIVLLDKYSLNEYITTEFPPNYEYEGKVAYIPENIELSIENLLELLLIYSANDAAYISAIAVSENVDDFIYLMNNKAKAFGMNDTNFLNPDGMDEENHYTTLNDLLKLTIKAVEKNEIVALVSKAKFVANITGKEQIYNSTNLLLEEGFIGLKTGWTDKAGLTFIGLNQNANREILTIVNKSKVDEKKYTHFSDTKLLYKSSIETYKDYKIINKNQNIYILRNSTSANEVKSKIDWIAFVNISKIYKIKLTEYYDNKIIFTYSKYNQSFKILDTNNKIKWNFNPLKLFKINANQY